MTAQMKKISPADIVAFDPFCGTFPLLTDIVYANAAHPENHFGQIYHKDAILQGHRDLVKIVLLVSYRLYQAHGWTLIVKDCLRPIEAQGLMVETDIVKANPHWLIEPRFLSSPGQGGHPRGMAVDLDALDATGQAVDFGTAFDHFSSATDKDRNPAHREHPDLTNQAGKNRLILTDAMISAAADFNLPMLPLPQEWWDFRFPSSYTNDFEAISDGDLLPHQKMIAAPDPLEVVADSQTLDELRRFV